MASIVLNGNTMGYNYGLESFKSVTTALNKSKSTTTSLAEKISRLNTGLSTYNARGTGTNNIAKAQEAIESAETKSNHLIEAVSTIDEKTEALLDTAVEVDNKVAKLINSKKKSFYKKYPHLKPECERSLVEKAWDHISNGIHSGVQFFSDIGNAIKNFAIDVWNWCCENIVAIGTALVVILTAALVVIIAPVLLPFVAALAGFLAIATFVADIICMIANEGKGIAEMLDESGHHTLSQVFTGFQWGCDIVEFVFPVGVAIKSLGKAGLKNIRKINIKEAVKTSFKNAASSIGNSCKNAFNKVFRSGFVNGIKNFFTGIKIQTKKIFTSIVDWDNLKPPKYKNTTKIKNDPLDVKDLLSKTTNVDTKDTEYREMFKKFILDDGLDEHPLPKIERPTPKQSEDWVIAPYIQQGYTKHLSTITMPDGTVKKSFYGASGSRIPDASNSIVGNNGTIKVLDIIEAKRYNVSNNNGIRNLKTNITKQYMDTVRSYGVDCKVTFIEDLTGIADRVTIENLEKLTNYIEKNIPDIDFLYTWKQK